MGDNLTQLKVSVQATFGDPVAGSPHSCGCMQYTHFEIANATMELLHCKELARIHWLAGSGCMKMPWVLTENGS